MRTAALVALCSGVLIAAAARADDLDRRLPVAPGGLLEVELDLGEGLRPDPGEISVRSHDADEVRLLAEPSGWGASGVAFRVESRAEVVRVYGRVEGAFSWLFGGPQVRLQIWVPREFSLDLRSSAGPIRVEDVRGRVRARTRDGSLEVSGAEGALKLRTAAGDVRVSEVVGDVDARTTAGAIELSWITGNIEVRTGDGRIDASHLDGGVALHTDRGEIEVRRMNGRLEAKTEQGSIFASFAGAPEGVLETRRGALEVVFPDGVGAELDAVARGGGIELPRGLDAGASTGDTFAGAINGGGLPVRLYTARGRIRVAGQ